GADVETDAVVEVRVPAYRLLFNRLPADEDVVGGFAFEDLFQFFLQGFSGGQALFGAVDAAGQVLLLAADPVTQVGVDQGFQILAVQLVVVDQGREAIRQAVPDMPDEGAVLEEFAVLGEELVPQPGFQG